MSHLAIALAIACQACSFTATAVGNSPCTRLLPSADAFYAGASAALGTVAVWPREPSTHDDDHVISDLMHPLGVALLVLAVPLALSAHHGFQRASEC